MTRPLMSAVFALLFLLSSRPASAQARFSFLQPDTHEEPTQVLSTNPIGLAARFLNVEYERRLADALSAGIGASHLPGTVGLGTYTNSDIFVRYYPGGRVFRGVSVDLKTGLTTYGNGGVAPGAGFDVNANHWLSERVVVSAGVGMKRVFAGDDSFVQRTIRIVNIGIGY